MAEEKERFAIADEYHKEFLEKQKPFFPVQERYEETQVAEYRNLKVRPKLKKCKVTSNKINFQMTKNKIISNRKCRITKLLPTNHQHCVLFMLFWQI